MDEFVVTKLTEWDSLAALIDRFRDNGVDEEVFNALNDEMIKDLIPQIGIRYKFTNKYKSYVASIISNSNIVIEDFSDIMSDVLSETTTESLASTSSIIVPEVPQQCVKKNVVKDLLERDPQGKEIMSCFKNCKKLERAKLAALLVDKQLENDPDTRMSKKSDLWNHFIKKDLGGVCKYCHVEVKTKGNTTNLRNHLVRRHPLIKTVSQKKKNDSSSGNTQNGDGSGQALESDAILDNIADSRNVDNSDTESVTSTHSTASASNSKQQTLTSCITNIKAFGDNGVKTGQINNAIVFMIAKDGLPLNTVEKTGFNYLMKTVAPLYKIPARKTITYMIDDKYDVLSSQFKLKIEEVEALSLTADVWTDPHNSQSYMGLTGHFIHENKMMSIVFGVSALTEPHNAEYLAHVITTMTDKWNIKSDKVIAFITDNGANIVKAVTIVYGKNKHMPCFAHTLNLVASKPFDNKDGLEEAKNLLTAVKEITSYFKHNTNAADSLKKAQEHKAKPLTLIQSVCTRWNSVFYQLERFVDLSQIIAPILLKYPKAPTMLTARQLEHIKDLINILRPLERITKEISGQNYVTVSKIIPIVSCLTETYNTMGTSTDVGAKTKTLIVEGLKKRFGNVEKVHLLATATILDPRFKKIHFIDHVACSRAIDRINILILDVQTQQQLPQDNSEENEYEEKNDAEKGIWNFHKLLVKKQLSSCNTLPQESQGLNEEFKHYLSQAVVHLNYDPILYWQEQKNSIYHHVYSTAMKYMCIVGSSVPCERLFSIAGNIASDERNRLDPARLDRLLFLKSLETKYWEL